MWESKTNKKTEALGLDPNLDFNVASGSDPLRSGRHSGQSLHRPTRHGKVNQRWRQPLSLMAQPRWLNPWHPTDGSTVSSLTEMLHSWTESAAMLCALRSAQLVDLA